MSVFEFFFSLYGLVLGLSVTAIAGGVAAAFEQRRAVRIGWLTPLLAAFVALDIASFWETAWTSFRDARFSYGLLVVGMTISLVYFVAASLVFPRDGASPATLDEHFWRNKRAVLLLTTLANLLVLATILLLRSRTPAAYPQLANYAVTGGLYVALIVPAAQARRTWLVATLLGLHTAIYLLIAAGSLIGSVGLP